LVAFYDPQPGNGERLILIGSEPTPGKTWLHLLHSGWCQLMACATIEATVRSTLDDVRVIELSRGARAVHLGVGQQADHRRAVGVDQQRLGASK